MIRSVTVHDPVFSRDDRMAALAWKAEDAQRCDGCGQLLYESTAEDGPEYNAVKVRCRGCEALSASATAAADQEPDPSAGMRYRIEKEKPWESL